MDKKYTLKDLRKSNSLTQEELAQASGVSTRTIQRIEKGLSHGSPHTIRALAEALNVDHTVLVRSENQPPLLLPTDDTDDLNKIRLLNFSILSIFLLPFGNIILPTLIFLYNKQDQYVNRIGRKIISFQIICTPILFFFTVIIFLLVGRGNGAIPLPVFICYALYVSASILIVILTSLSIEREQDAPRFFPKIV